MPERSLPAVIGPTENALRALLLRTLERTRVAGYEEWAHLNLRSAAATEEEIAASLRLTPHELSKISDGLRRRALLTPEGVLTPAGAEVLAEARAAVAETTRTVTEGVTDQDAAVTRRVLDSIRANAEGRLAS